MHESPLSLQAHQQMPSVEEWNDLGGERYDVIDAVLNCWTFNLSAHIACCCYGQWLCMGKSKVKNIY